MKLSRKSGSEMNKSFFQKIQNSLRWTIFVTNRFSLVDRKGKSRASSILSTLGICFGVMTLITVVSVMNGFQMSFIDSIMEISSYHVQVSLPSENTFLSTETEGAETGEKLNVFSDKTVVSHFPFMEAQGLFTSEKGREVSSIIRAVPSDIMEMDKGFEKELKIISGSFDLSEPENIVIGSYLAHTIGVFEGSKISLSALSGGKDVDLLSDKRIFTVKGIFECGYADINQAYTFISLESGEKYFGTDAKITYAVKLKDYRADDGFIRKLKETVPSSKAVSWREYNRSFFGALRIEKNILMLTVFLIFVVVAINIYNSMRRLVFERRMEISTMYALGAGGGSIKFIFILRGLFTGLIGTFFGVVFALCLTKNMDKVFMFFSDVMFWAEYALTAAFSPDNLIYVRENPMYSVYASIPARILYSEVLFISFFAVASPLFSSYLASRNVLKMNVAEVLHNE